MAGGKLTPRQKMINMMYLVLTALLAMNVSAEILNAFKTVNNSITHSNTIIMDKNKTTYDNFKAAVEDPTTKVKATQWKSYADKAKTISDALYDHIGNVKTQIKEAAGLKVDEEGNEEYKLDDLDVASRIMVDGGEGQKLYDEMNSFKGNLLSSIDLNDFAENPKIKAAVEDQLKQLDHSMPIDLSIPPSTSGNQYSQDGNGWAQSNFHMAPAVAAVTILTKLQNDVRSSQTQFIDYCYSQIGQVKVVYDEFQAIASANTNYCMPGDPIEVTAGVGAFSAAAKPTITINGANVPLDGGQAIYKTKASGTGTRSIPVVIQFTKPDGEIARVEKTIKYTVGTPSGAAVQFDKMNVLYIGVDNPITVKSSVGAEKTRVSISQGSLSGTGAGRYNVRVTRPSNNETITINADGEVNKFPVRVKLIPDPIPTLGGDENLTKNGKGQKGQIKAKGGIVPLLKNFDFEARFNVVSYDCYLTSGGELLPARGNSGPMFTGPVNNLIGRAKPKDMLIFDNIVVKGPDGNKRKIPSMSFQIL